MSWIIEWLVKWYELPIPRLRHKKNGLKRPENKGRNSCSKYLPLFIELNQLHSSGDPTEHTRIGISKR